MAERVLYPEWRDYNRPTGYPFAERATLTNGTAVFPADAIADARVHLAGAGPGLYLASVEVGYDSAIVTLASPGIFPTCTATVAYDSGTDIVQLLDERGRPAGILVGREIDALDELRTMGFGLHEFTFDQTELAATVCEPVPAAGVEGFELDDGEYASGKVWLVGGDGVVLRRGDLPTDMRVDIVGDPLYRRKLCEPEGLYVRPTPIKFLRIVGPDHEFTIPVEGNQHLQIVSDNNLVSDPVLRLNVVSGALVFSVVGG